MASNHITVSRALAERLIEKFEIELEAKIWWRGIPGGSPDDSEQKRIEQILSELRLATKCPHCVQGYIQETGFQPCEYCNADQIPTSAPRLCDMLGLDAGSFSRFVDEQKLLEESSEQ